MRTSTGQKLSGWWLDKVRANASDSLDGETLLAATYGQQANSLIASLVSFWRPRLLAATGANIYLFKGGTFNSAKVGELLAKSPIASPDFQRNGRALVVSGVKIWTPPGSSRETSQLIDVIMSRRASAEAPIARTESTDTSMPPPSA